MRIIVCEDSVQDAYYLTEQLRLSLGERLKELIVYTSGEELLEKEEKQEFDLLFLDIYLKKMGGIAVAKELRRKGKKGKIVLVSSSRQFGPESYEIQAAWYLLKPYSPESLKEVLDHCLAGEKEAELTVSVHGSQVCVPESQIEYIETEGRRLAVHIGQEKLYIYDSMERIYGELDKNNFIRPHRSYILNMAFIERIEENSFRLQNGELVSINRNQRKQIKELYHKYLFRALKTVGEG